MIITKHNSIVITLSTLLLSFCGTPFLFSKGTTQDATPIIIESESNQPEEEPRGPVFNPFSAYCLNNQVVLESSVSYGPVSVSLTSTAGDNYSTVFDTEDGFIIIPISGLSGDYTLSLVDATGQRFVGEFEI